MPKHLHLPGSRTIGAPPGWDHDLDGQCGSINVVDYVDVQSGLNQMFTFYSFSKEELVALADGGILRLGILGHLHPVFNMCVLSSEIGKQCNAQESLDMGGVVEAE